MNKLKYEVVDKDILIINEAPRVLSKELIDTLDINKYKCVMLCEDIEEIGEGAFSNTKIKKITLPNSLKVINNYAFSWSEIDEIIIPDGTILIGRNAFEFCRYLENVIFPNSLKKIDRNAFYNCLELTVLVLPKDLKYIGECAFEKCNKLEVINIPDSISEIKNRTFFDCGSLEEISLSSNTQIIGFSAFENCRKLKNIYNLDNVIKLRDNAFYGCDNLKTINLSNKLENIGARCFAFNGSLQSIYIPNSVKEIGEEAFYACNKLSHVMLPRDLKKINNGTFQCCNSLAIIDIPSSVTYIGKEVFKYASKLTNIDLPDCLEFIDEEAFSCCSNLKEIIIPSNVIGIGEAAFFGSFSLKKISFSNKLKYISDDCFLLNDCHDEVRIYDEFNNDLVILKNCEFTFNEDNIPCYYDKEEKVYYFLKNGKIESFSESLFKKNSNIKRMIDNDEIYDEYYIRLFYYMKKRFVPSSEIIKNMPLSDIDNFYINNNAMKWKELVSLVSEFTSNDNKVSFFKLCYVLGLFSEKASIRDKAYDFIKDNIINELNEFDIHEKFDGFSLKNGFNEEYSEFFMMYFNGKDFMVTNNERDDIIDLTSASYNNFKNVKQLYPNKSLHTNRKVDILLPSHIMDAVKSIWYNNVDNGNEDFALTVGRYGYNQVQFEELQRWYNIGKSIAEEDLKLIICEDNFDKGIKYKFIDKSNPIGAVLGNITNCCQVVDGNGASCVKYGMTMPNSCFITFNYKDKIIGQAWVWYDKESGTICLDNIEVPSRYCDEIKNNKMIQKSFIDCLLRLEDNFKKTMINKGFEVSKVTIGKGYNDLKEILDKEFNVVEFPNRLSDYVGYSDSSVQYEIKSLRKLKK